MPDVPDVSKKPVEYKKGGGPDQLPQGEAGQLNQGMEQVRENEAQNPEYVPQDVEFGEPDRLRPEVPGNEQDDMLYGPSARPNEPITAGRIPPGVRTHVPAQAEAWLGALAEASQDEDAPIELKSMMKLLLYHTGNDNA